MTENCLDTLTLSINENLYLGAGATGLAAVLQGLLPELKGKKCAFFRVFQNHTKYS